MSDCFDHGADAWDSLLWGSDEECCGWGPREVTCNRCGQPGLEWDTLANGGYTLKMASCMTAA